LSRVERSVLSVVERPVLNMVERMLENLFDHLLIFDQSDDSHLTLAPFDRLRTGLGQLRGSLFPDQVQDGLQFSESASPNSFDIPWMIPPAPGCMVSIHPGFVSYFPLGNSRLQPHSPLSGTWELIAASHSKASKTFSFWAFPDQCREQALDS